MKRYRVWALGTDALETKTIEAENEEEAEEKYRELWLQGQVQAEDYRLHDFDIWEVEEPAETPESSV